MWEKIKQYAIKQIKDIKDNPKIIIKKWWFWLLIISIISVFAVIVLVIFFIFSLTHK